MGRAKELEQEKARARKRKGGRETDSWLLKSTAEIKLYNNKGALILN